MHRDSLTYRTINSLLWMFWGKCGQMLLNVIVLVILARLLTPREFGIVGAATVAVSFSQIFSQIGMKPALVQLVALNTKHLHVGFTLALMAGMLVGATFFLVSPAVATFFDMPALVQILRVFSLVFPITGLGIVAEAMLLRELKFRQLAGIEVLSYGLGYGLFGILLALWGFGVWALAVAQLIQAAARAVCLVCIRPGSMGLMLDRPTACQLLDFSAGFSLGRVANHIASQMDYLVVGTGMGAMSLGIYSKAYQFLMMPTNLLGQVFDNALFPSLALVQGNQVRLARAYSRSVASSIMVTLPLSCYMIIVAPELVGLLLGPNWTDVVPPFQWLAAALVFRAGYKVSDSLARATGAVYHRAWRHVVYAFAVFLGAWFGQRWGLRGVGAGVALAITINYLLMLQLGLRITGLPWVHFLFPFLRHLCVAVLVGVTALAVARFGRSAAWHDLSILLGSALAIGGLITCLVAFSAWLFGEEGDWLGAILKQRLGLMRERTVHMQQERV